MTTDSVFQIRVGASVDFELVMYPKTHNHFADNISIDFGFDILWFFEVPQTPEDVYVPSLHRWTPKVPVV
jgi:hypothetical protein